MCYIIGDDNLLSLTGERFRGVRAHSLSRSLSLACLCCIEIQYLFRGVVREIGTRRLPIVKAFNT